MLLLINLILVEYFGGHLSVYYKLTILSNFASTMFTISLKFVSLLTLFSCKIIRCGNG